MESIGSIDDFIKAIKNLTKEQQLQSIVFNINSFNADKNENSTILQIQLIDTAVIEIIEKSKTELNISFSEINEYHNRILNNF